MTRNTFLTLSAAAVLTLTLGFGASEAEARAQYNKAFKSTYESAFEGKDVTLKCNVCHGEGGKNKKVLSGYGTALKAELGEKNLKDNDKISAALTATAAKPSETEGKTYGDLLTAGELPKLAE